MKKLLSILMVAVMTTLLFAGCAKESEGDKSESSDTIKFGMLGALSGSVSVYGIAVKNGTELAVKEINEAGGIDGKKVELVAYDTEGDPSKAINLVNRLIDDDKITALIGPTFSGESLTVAPIMNEKKIPMLTPTATNADVTQNMPYVFRACYIDPYQGGTIAKYASDIFGAEKAVIFQNDGSDYSVGLSEAFQDAFTGEVLAIESYTDDDKDFKATITKIAALDPDLIFIPDYKQMVGIIATQLNEAGVKVPMIGGDGWDGVEVDYAEVMNRQVFANHYVATEPKENVQAFVKAYEAEYGEVPNALAALAYDSAKMMAEAIDSADSTGGEDIIKSLASAEYPGVTGNIHFDDQGDATGKEIVFIKIVDGKLTLDAKVSE